MNYTAHNPSLEVPDYSGYHAGCDSCGRIISQVRETVPLPCYVCFRAHYCSLDCLAKAMRAGHRRACNAILDTEIDISGAENLSTSQALWDLRRYTTRWHDQLGCAAVAALNLHSDPSAMTRQALVVHLSYVVRQPYRMRRLLLRDVTVEPLARLAGSNMEAAIWRREQYSLVNQRNGMVGCALIVLACDVPGVGFVFNSTFVGPEPSLLAAPPPADWREKLWATVRKNEIP